MIELFKNKESPVKINFRVRPRDFMHDRILLLLETIEALNKAANILKETTKGNYEIILTRGYINWDIRRLFQGVLAKTIFYFLYRDDKSDAKLLFSSNGHDDGLSVDIQLYDMSFQKVIKFLPWQNVIISRAKAENILEVNRRLIRMLDMSMESAGFIVHPDPREKLQMHYRLEIGSTSDKG